MYSNYYLESLAFNLESSFSISCKASLPATNSLFIWESLCFTFSFESSLLDIELLFDFFFFILSILKVICYFLALLFLLKWSAVDISLRVTSCFSLATFKLFSCLLAFLFLLGHVCFLNSLCLCYLEFIWVPEYVSYCFTKNLGKFLAVISLNVFSAPFSLLFYWNSYDVYVGVLKGHTYFSEAMFTFKKFFFL